MMEESKTIGLEELVALANRQAVRPEMSDAETDGLAPGYLGPEDVCRLFDDGNVKTPDGEGATARARRLIAAKALPLMEIGAGRFQVMHSIGGSR